LVVPGAWLHPAEVTLKPQNRVCTQITFVSWITLISQGLVMDS
jgi:hypothetical protein